MAHLIFILAAVFYEYAITVELELTTVWKRKWTVTSALLISSRWVAFLYALLSVIPMPPRVSSVSVFLYSIHAIAERGTHVEQA